MVTLTAPSRHETGRAGSLEPRRTPFAWSKIPVTAVLVIAAIYFLIPVVWVLISSTKSGGDLFGTPGLWFSSHPQLLENIQRLFTQDAGSYGIWLLNSILYAGVGAFVAMVMSAGAGYAIAKYSFRGKEFLFALVLGGVLVPATVIALPLYFLLNSVGLTGTYWSVLLPGMVSPFGVYLARIYATASVPDEIIEAARLDGAGDLRIFATIATRMMGPALVTIFLFQFVGIWNNYLLPLVMLSDTNTFPVTLGLTLWNSQTQRDPAFYQLVVTGSAFSAVILVAVMVSLQRFWRAGLTAGATKG
ncbi:sugar ABC transporter permease [Leifsonia sp. LS1]|uniref:carbohydrate ABC transporter permease n=1 Tax=Leifsonia sp. LS1 TaxID=2828483 RepID=UPI001CFEDA20|nr:carbohydrate ABC transporter permease [Leifsonia sp. LS1]GIT81322.1 sugar ABC transporter permease [Leifsonia sp. LS1]